MNLRTTVAAEAETRLRTLPTAMARRLHCAPA